MGQTDVLRPEVAMTFDEVPILDPLIHEFAIVFQEFQLPCANPVCGIRR
jgi:hypothetical protein